MLFSDNSKGGDNVYISDGRECVTGSYLEQCKRLVEASRCKSKVSRSVVCIMTATLDDVWSF